jgi:hypothetical protein
MKDHLLDLADDGMVARLEVVEDGNELGDCSRINGGLLPDWK